MSKRFKSIAVVTISIVAFGYMLFVKVQEMRDLRNSLAELEEPEQEPAASEVQAGESLQPERESRVVPRPKSELARPSRKLHKDSLDEIEEAVSAEDRKPVQMSEEPMTLREATDTLQDLHSAKESLESFFGQ